MFLDYARRGTITSFHSTLNGIENKSVAGIKKEILEILDKLKTINNIQVVSILDILLLGFDANKDKLQTNFFTHSINVGTVFVISESILMLNSPFI